MDRSSVRRLVLKYGFTPIRIRTEESRHQLTLALTAADEVAFYLRRKKEKFNIG